jgi:hypothetical protein
VVVATAPARTVVGTNGADVLRGGSSADTLYGKAGADRLYGLEGDDRLDGGPGSDVLVGGAGNDRLDARDGAPDVARCGPGSDIAVVDLRDRVSAGCEKVLGPPADDGIVIAGAGDIAGAHPNDELTARLLDRIRPDVVFTTGDNAYPDGRHSDFRDYYEPTWGRHRSTTRPSPGNHDYHTSGAAGYFDYFGARAPGPYYSYDLGRWHLISLDSEQPVEPGSAQYEWLRADLARSKARCTLAYWHKPRFTSGRYDDFEFTKPLWQLLYAARAELVLNGHDHNYQRYNLLDPEGNPDPESGIREIVVGTGGAGLYPIRRDSRRKTGSDATRGVLRVSLRPAGYAWEFVPVSGNYRDSGSATCKG